MLYFILFSLIRITCDRLDGTRGTRVRPRERQGKHAQSQGTPPAQPPTPPIHTPPKRLNPHPAATTRSHTGTPWPWFHSSALVSDDSVGRVWRLALPFFFSSFLPFFLLFCFLCSAPSFLRLMACRFVRVFVVVCLRRFRCAFLLSLSLGSFRQLLDASTLARRTARSD